MTAGSGLIRAYLAAVGSLLDGFRIKSQGLAFGRQLSVIRYGLIMHWRGVMTRRVVAFVAAAVLSACASPNYVSTATQDEIRADYARQAALEADMRKHEARVQADRAAYPEPVITEADRLECQLMRSQSYQMHDAARPSVLGLEASGWAQITYDQCMQMKAAQRAVH